MAISSIDTSPSVRLALTPTSLLRFPPEPLPSTLPPPSGESTFAHPFAIPPNVYNALLSVHIPITVALVYATTATILNRYNEKRDYKPWAISKTRAFRAFVIAHNVLLALYSAWTFVAMIHAVRLSLEGATDEHGLVGAVDALCKINGPRGLGDAATFNASTSTWGFTNRALKLAANTMPDTTDIGRIWNEGLAFYGWLFYLSKFYEVLDTLIILAKGKKSSFLQTYHHAGAMMCMWAGIRYMAPPIWMFVLVNSFIHTLMYTYFTASVLGVKVPNQIKRLITTMQIVQFIIGATFAFAHLFIAYTIPISVPYIYSLADLTSAVASDMSAAASTATASASAGLGSWLKKVAFRAAGEEGLAENVRNDQGKAFGIDAIHAAKDLKARQEIRYRDEYRLIRCTDTSGQVFAILMNCFYLAPLTLLFVRFFIRSYTRRNENQKQTSKRHMIEESSKEAANEVKREVGQALDEKPGSMEDDDGARSSSSKNETDSAARKEDSKSKEDSQKQDEEENPKPDDGGNLKHGGESKQDSKPEQDAKSEQDGEPKQDAKDDQADEDVEILDSAEAVTDVLDAGSDNADKFSKELKDSKAG